VKSTCASPEAMVVLHVDGVVASVDVSITMLILVYEEMLRSVGNTDAGMVSLVPLPLSYCPVKVVELIIGASVVASTTRFAVAGSLGVSAGIVYLAVIA